MSDYNSYGAGGGLVKLVLFIIAVILASPFFAIGHYKNVRIRASVDRSVEELKNENLISAQEEIESGASHFGMLYSIYVKVLPLIGGTYYCETSFVMLRGLARTAGAAQRLEQGEDISQLLDMAERDLIRRGNLDSDMKKVYDSGHANLDSLRTLVRIYDSYNSGERLEASKNLIHYFTNKRNFEAEFAIRPALSLLVKMGEEYPEPFLFDGKPISMPLMAVTMASTLKEEVPNSQFVARLYSRTRLIDAESSFTDAAIERLIAGQQPASSYSTTSSTSSVSSASLNREELRQQYQRGMAAARNNNFTEALPLLRECYNNMPDNDNFALALAMVKRRMDQNEKARQLCQEILQRDPEHERARSLLASLD